MITLKKIFRADLQRILCNRVLSLTLIIPPILVMILCVLQLENTLQFQKTGYDIWVLFSKDILLTLTFIFPLLSIVYPFVIFENEHRYNGPRTHAIFPLPISNYFLSKILIIWLFILFIILTSSLLLLIAGYLIGSIYKIGEFLLYLPLFILYYALAMIPICLFLSLLHVVLNIFFKNILINTVPFLLVLFVSFFLTGWKYNFLIPHSYPFYMLSNLQFHHQVFLDFPIVISIGGVILILFLLNFGVTKLQHLWIK